MTNGVGSRMRAISDAAPTQRMTANWRGDRGPESAREHAEQVGDEWSGGQRREAHRFQSAATGDRRKERRDQGHAHPDADGGQQVEREIAPERAPIRRCER